MDRISARWRLHHQTYRDRASCWSRGHVATREFDSHSLVRQQRPRPNLDGVHENGDGVDVDSTGGPDSEHVADDDKSDSVVGVMDND